MGKLVWMVGAFGAGMALFGATAALFTGGVGISSGVDEAEAFTGKGFGGVLMACLGFVGAWMAKTKLQAGAALLVVSSVVGFVLLLWFYAAGAVIMLSAVGIAFVSRAEPDGRG